MSSPASVAGQLDVLWTEVEGATGYKVRWKSGMDDYSDMRQVSVGACGWRQRLGVGTGSEGQEDDVSRWRPFTWCR